LSSAQRKVEKENPPRKKNSDFFFTHPPLTRAKKSEFAHKLTIFKGIREPQAVSHLSWTPHPQRTSNFL
jgi:hypothetical protein